MPGCALTTPKVSACQVQTPLATTNDASAQKLTASVTLPAGNLVSTLKPKASGIVGPAAAPASLAVAAVAGAGGSQGDYTATSLSASGSWAQSASGAFTYSYPVATPPALGGGSPSVALSYNSQSIDGETSARNSQSSWIGDGWSYSPGFLERSYKPCRYDGIKDSGDECWAGYNATLSLGSHTGQLVRDKDGVYHLSSDDGTKIERLTGAGNGLWDGEYFKVSTTDGTAYYLGLNHAPGTTSDAATNSAWGVPVYHPKSGDPCYDSDKGDDSQCAKPVGYRFNLDFVVDPHGNAQRYEYATESNYYNMGYGQVAKDDKGGTLTQYTRGGYLTRISYGYKLADAIAGKEPAARINFTTAQRCTTSDSVCTYDNLKKDTATNWPDVPYDTNCPSTYKTHSDDEDATDVCKLGSPTFWSTYRLKKITTQVKTGSGFQDVDSYNLTHVFSDAGGVIDPVTGKTTDPKNAGKLQSVMWLSSIQHTGLDTSAGGSGPITLDPVTFTGIEMDNRVDGLDPGAPPLYHPRISSIRTESGESVAVTYRNPECSRVNHTMPSSADSNTMACYPVHWNPAGAITPIDDWFHKTLVIQVTDSDLTKANSAPKVTNYAYGGGAAWHRDDSDLTDDQYRDWSDFRGYRTVTTTTGTAPDPITKSVSTYLQGMDGDYKKDGSKRSVSIKNSVDDTAVTDSNWLAGATLETAVYSNASGIPVSKTLNGPLTATTTASTSRTAWTSKDPAPDTLSTLPDLAARRTTSTTNRTMELLADGSWRTKKGITEYDSHGRVRQVDDKGDVSDSKQERCTITSYADAPSDNPMMLTYPSETLELVGGCDTTPDSKTTLSHKRLFYDGDGTVSTPGTYGKLGQSWASDNKSHSLGYLTATQTVTKYDSGGDPVYQTLAAVTYDDYGRVTKTLDTTSQATTTAYSPSTGILPTKVTTTYPQPFGWTTTVTVDPGRGLTTQSVDANNRVTEMTYDALGRRTQVWMPGRDRATQSADRKFTYAVHGSGDSPDPNTVTTQTLREDETYSMAVSIYDGLLRARQQQTTTADNSAGRLISSTGYDSHGWTVSSIAAYSDPTTAPSTTMWVERENTVPSQTRTVYDGQGRAVATQQWSRAVKLWESTTAYPGADRTETTPPGGGQPSVTYTNAQGQKTATRLKDTAPDRKLPTGTVIASGSQVASNSVRLTMQPDGNLVLTGITSGQTLWQSNTAGNPGASATVRTDGSLVVTSTTGTVLWNSGSATAGTTGAYAMVRGDAGFQIYNAAGKSVWNSGTQGKAAAADVTTSYTYTAAGQTESIRDTLGNTWSYTYDLLGRKTGQTDPDAGPSSYSYDQQGRLAQSTDSRGQTLSYAYDGLGRKTGLYDGTSTTEPAKQLAAWTYDTLAKGYPTSSTRYVGGANGNAYTKKVNGYNTAYQPTGTTTVIPAAEGKLAGTYSTSAAYTPRVGLLQSTAYAADGGLPAETVGYGYNLQGGLVETGSDLAPYLDITLYTPLGQVIQSTYGLYGKQLRTAQTYDQATGRLATNTVSLQTNSTNPIDATTYGYDQAGNLTAANDVQSSGGTTTGIDTQCFAYDGLNRLAEAWTDTKGTTAPATGQLAQCNTATPSAATLGGPAPYWQSFTYNLLGDRTQQVKHDTTGNALKNTVQTSAYPGSGTTQAARPNTATSITTTGPSGPTTLTPHYDAAGNTTSRDTKSGSAAATTQTLTYNSEGRTDTVTTPKAGGGTQTSNYVYDADGNLLVQKGADSNVLYLFGGAEQLTLTKATDKVAGLRYYTSPDGTRITRSSAGTLTYQPTNPQKTAQLQVDASSLAVTRRAYDPYGAPRGTTPASWIDNRGYLGKPVDTTSGLNLLGARNYDPVLGRFLSVDPVFEAGDPNQMGGYTYAGDDPVNGSDPNGLWWHPSWSSVGNFFTGVGDSVVGTPWEWGVNGLGYFGNSISSIWNGENELFNEWTGWDGPPGMLGLELPHNSWQSDGHPLADLFGVDTTSTSYVAGEITGAVAQVAADGYGVYKLAKEYKATKAAVAAGAEVGEAGGTASRMLRDDPGAGKPPAKPDAGKPADTSKPSKPSSGTHDSPEPAPEAPVEAGSGAGKCSFTPETLVLMDQGKTKPIGKIKVGEKVEAADPATGKDKGPRQVTAKFVNHDYDLIDISVRGDNGKAATLHTTSEHPFWDATDENWVPAGKLKAGHALTTDKGQHVTLIAIHKVTGAADMHNLTVAELHTYYVLAGSSPVLVHNTCPTSAALRAAPSPEHASLPTHEAKKTAARAGNSVAVSGYSTDVPTGFSRATPEQVLNAMPNHLRTPNAFMDNSAGPGAYYLSHAERQVSTLNSTDSISVSRVMCDNCIGWFQERAKQLGHELSVTDPDVINVFKPDGTWEAVDHPGWW
ncbi:polymorphic toxin-type HINT domain-containing protein [Streptomyces sp. YS-3]|uniref:polymorphic toxin-type HINT domain-containing protein n=1 Tax=Streptomyces sp. YS-3 TaxID=3381352 RepID=UPI0038628A79